MDARAKQLAESICVVVREARKQYPGNPIVEELAGDTEKRLAEWLVLSQNPSSDPEEVRDALVALMATEERLFVTTQGPDAGAWMVN